MGRTACTEPQCLYSTAIPLHPLWAVRPVQSLSACTVELYLYSPYGPYGLYRTSVPVQYSYTSTPPMDRTACTEPQCLYSRAIPLLPLWTVRPVQSLSAGTRVHFTLFYVTTAYNAWSELGTIYINTEVFCCIMIYRTTQGSALMTKSCVNINCQKNVLKEKVNA